ncbi:MAG: cation transporter [Planctomycetes bacterium]|nr:cation transporter [Planctomycetota bacterium]
MGHSHSHAHADGTSGRRLAYSIILTLGFVAAEVVAGYFAHSLALVSDAGHNFADAVALCISAYALWVAKKPSNHRKTFGYHRAGILAALANSVSLVVIAVFIAIESFERISHPVDVHAAPMIGVAFAAILLNTTIALWLRAGSKDNINIRSAYVHMAGDAVAGVGLACAGIAVGWTGSPIADPIVSLMIAGLILWSSWGVLSESVHVLLEGTPAGVDMDRVIATLLKVPGVSQVHDLHVWTVGPGVIACSCHIVVSEEAILGGEQVLRAATHALNHAFDIHHTTVQIEVEGCDPDEMYCTMHKKGRRADAGH